MALLLKSVIEGYDYIVNDLADFRTKDWLMVKSPISVAALIVGYLMFVRHFGPKYMQNRKPFNIDKILIVYNAFQVVLCTYLCYKLFPPCYYGNILCEEVNESDHSTEVAHTSYIYYWTKIIDLLDTVFFVLRKNTRQVSFLHLYHHSMMVTYVWYVMKFYPGGQFIYVGFINSFVHIIMYSYYLLTVYDRSVKKSFWWKKHITQLQLFQFFLYSILFLLPLTQKQCNFPKALCMVVLPQVSTLTFLFADFYYRNYICGKLKDTDGVQSVKEKQSSEHLKQNGNSTKEENMLNGTNGECIKQR